MSDRAIGSNWHKVMAAGAKESRSRITDASVVGMLSWVDAADEMALEQ